MEYDTSTVNGGILRGRSARKRHSYDRVQPEQHDFNGVTTLHSVDLIQNGHATFTNFTNGGRLTNNNAAQREGGTNTASGIIVVNQ